MFAFGPKPEKLKEKGDIEGLLKLLDHKKLEVRKEVATILREWAKPECKNALLKALMDENQGIRVYAVQGLAKLKDPQTDEALASAAQDSDWEVRKEALSALVKSGRNIDAMLQAIRFNSAELRELAAVRLGDTGGSQAVEALIVALKDEEELVRLRAVNALAKIKDPQSRIPLQEATQDKDPQVSKAAQAVLETIKNL
ncbi:HEAT repeat domain-containing protein [bacterium]|nr:HEAT repeat domain-containing protein [bacterium]MCI0605992.1 HEAT repeat domain-containing protein [bacterium]